MLSLAATYMGYPVGGGPGPGAWALVGPLWLLLWFFVIAGVIFFCVGRGRRAWWTRGGPWGTGGPGRPGGPWGPPPEGPEAQPSQPSPGEPPEAALDRARAILHERYARGEISTEEYRERIDNLV